jgi:hypothetical protein
LLCQGSQTSLISQYIFDRDVEQSTISAVFFVSPFPLNQIFNANG